jgi:hypothetical protein
LCYYRKRNVERRHSGRIYATSHPPRNLDLATIDRQIRARTNALDWCYVLITNPGRLETLLVGLELVEHHEALGLASVPDAREETIS